MTAPLIWTSVTRIIARSGRSCGWHSRPRAAWSEGDYVVAEVTAAAGGVIEAPDAHIARVEQGDRVVGVLGTRQATLEAVGDWRLVDEDGNLQTLTRGGVFGRVTSAAREVESLLVDLRYLGHLELDGAPTRMSDWALGAGRAAGREVPAIVLVGTSMSSGKTTTARVVIRRLMRMGLTVAGAKITGVARRADIIAMRDAGAATVFDFVDAGLPSTIASPSTVADATRRVLAAVDATGADVLVAEAGASPLEPYGGEAALSLLAPRSCLMILCASDPYAVVGGISAFAWRPDLVAGRAASTSAAITLVSRLSGIDALDVTDPGVWPKLDEMLTRSLAGR